MLVGEREEAGADLIVVAEDDAAAPVATKALWALRKEGLNVDIIATGSAKKRFDKAMKLGSKIILSLRTTAAGPSDGLKWNHGEAEQIQQAWLRVKPDVFA
jgi:histidyl-tRNA synthetase